MININKKPGVGIGVYILKDNKVLLGKRKNTHGEGSWCPPGGHLEFNETIQACAIREVQEETGLNIKNIRLGPYTNDMFKKENKHYITLCILADYAGGKPKILEPKKCECWQWFTWDKLPQPLFLPTYNLIKQDFNPFK